MPSLSPALKRVLSIAFVAGVVFFGAKTCQVESADCEFVFRFRGDVAGGLQRLEVHLLDSQPSASAADNEPLGSFTKFYEQGSAGAPARWPLVISADAYWIIGEITTGKGTFAFERKVTLVDGEAQSVYLDRYLRE